MITYPQAIILGALQGVTELFPISSLGHTVVLPKLFGWSLAQNDPYLLSFLVATHTATALVLFLFFWKDWRRIIAGMFRSLKAREVQVADTDARLGWLLVIATVPAGILGLLFEEPLKHLFAQPQIVAFVLMLNGALLYCGELLRRRVAETSAVGSDERIGRMSWLSAIKIGVFQCLALIPGFSRTGSTITGGLLTGLSHEDAARFSFLLATPIIGAASVLKLPDLVTPAGKTILGPTLLGALASAICAYLAVRFLTKYFETNKLTPFAIYCFVVGLLLSILFLWWR